MERATRLPSIRSKTITLVLACALPTILGFAALSYDAYTRQHAHLVHDAERMAQALSLAVERDLSASEIAARALASSPSLTSGDLAAFRQQAASLLTADFPAFAFVLSDANGKPLLNTRFAPGAPLPPNGNAAAIARVFASATASTSDLYQGDPLQPQMVSVDVPVTRGAKVLYVLSAQLRPEQINALLADQHIPPGWIAQVFDAHAVFVARSENAHRVVGQSADPRMLEAMAHDRDGVISLSADRGPTIQAAFHRARRGWFVTVAVPGDAADGVLGSTLAGMLMAIGALLAIGFATAWSIGGAIGRSVRALCAPAAALGRGEPLVIAPMNIREPAEVAAALKQLEGELLRYRSGLEDLVGARTAALERSNALLANVYATAPVGLALLDCDLRVVMVNDYLASINNEPVEAHLGRTLPEILGPLGAEYEQPYRQVRDSGQPLLAVETSGPTPAVPDIERHWIVSYHPVYGSDHAMVGVSAVILDVSERKVLSQRLRDVNEQFRALYENSGDAHMLVAFNAGLVSCNQAAARMFGYTSTAEFLAQPLDSMWPEFQPDGCRSDQRAAEVIAYAMENGSHHFEWIHRRRDGSLFDTDVLLTSLNIGGKGIVQATVRDISERVAGERALRATSERLEQSERFIRTVTDNVPGMVGYWDAQLRCQFANRLYLDFFGLKEEDLLGQPIDVVLGADLLAENAPYLREVLAGRAAHFAHEMRDPSGQMRHTWANYIPDFDEKNQVRGFYVLISDISELKRTEMRLQSLNEQLIQALDRAEMASSAKTEFLANMSHEIRTPMNAIMGLARLLEEAPLGRRERDYVAKMTMSTRSLLGILNDVLDFSKIEAGQLKLEHTSFPLDQVLHSIAVLVAPNAANKGVELVFDAAPEVPLALTGDSMRLEQVLLNLIGNAIKFTEQGEVVLTIRVIDRCADEINLRFSVRDTGIGIAPAHQAHMFDAFSQGDTSTSRKYGGTGLGLAICRRLVQLMGGAISVQSALGKGSTFSFDVRLGAAGDAAVPAMPPLPGLAGCRLLLVDDNDSARAAIARQCRSFGWEVDSVASGAAALECLRGAPAYDFLIVDSAMPAMDGISLLTHARADAGTALPRCAMMVTESARARLDDMAAELQLDVILSKPVTPVTLLGALLELHGGPPQAGEASPRSALAGCLQGLRVLLVEDNQINQEVANYILLHAGAQVDIAANGRIAVSMLAEQPSRYDAVLMDIQMPVMNGYEAAEEIRRMGLTDLPVIAMTANAMEDDRRQALESGMNGHVPKPIDVDRLVEALNAVTGAGDAPGARAAGRATASAQALPAAIPGIDLGPTLLRFGGNYANFVSVFKRFESSQGGTLAQVRELVRAGRRDEAVALIHRLRGVAANLGAGQVATAAIEAEQALRSAGENALLERLATLEAALAKVMQAARELAPPPAPSSAPAPGRVDLHGALADLLALLQNNNLKAIAAFGALRPALDTALAPAEVAALADAIATLAFANAAALVQELVNRHVESKGSA